MKIEVKIENDCKEPKVVILTDRMSDEVNEIIRKLSENIPQMIAGFPDDLLKVLDQEEIFHLFTENGKVYARTGDGMYSLRTRMYELEERLDKNTFVRISNSEIINLKKVRAFDLSLAGTILVSLTNGTITYVSRRYVPKIKQVLGI